MKPPFALEGKLATVRTTDARGREIVASGPALEVWLKYVLAPLASGYASSAEIRATPGRRKPWHRIEFSSEEALALLQEQLATGSPLLASVHAERVRRLKEDPPEASTGFRCRYQSGGRQCERRALEMWSTCTVHRHFGVSRQEWLSAHQGERRTSRPEKVVYLLRCVFLPMGVTKSGRTVMLRPWGQDSWETEWEEPTPLDLTALKETGPEWVRGWQGPFDIQYEVVKE